MSVPETPVLSCDDARIVGWLGVCLYSTTRVNGVSGPGWFTTIASW